MSATSTPESASVGIITHHTLSPLIINKYGSYGSKDPDALSGWNIVSADESLTPFINEVYSDRATLAVLNSGNLKFIKFDERLFELISN
jgi:hypothetical protein